MIFCQLRTRPDRGKEATRDRGQLGRVQHRRWLKGALAQVYSLASKLFHCYIMVVIVVFAKTESSLCYVKLFVVNWFCS